MKRFLLFTWMTRPEGGLGDLFGAFDTFEGAKSQTKLPIHWQILDTQTGFRWYSPSLGGRE